MFLPETIEVLSLDYFLLNLYNFLTENYFLFVQFSFSIIGFDMTACPPFQFLWALSYYPEQSDGKCCLLFYQFTQFTGLIANLTQGHRLGCTTSVCKAQSLYDHSILLYTHVLITSHICSVEKSASARFGRNGRGGCLLDGCQKLAIFSLSEIKGKSIPERGNSKSKDMTRGLGNDSMLGVL